jgi:hypothetical protein
MQCELRRVAARIRGDLGPAPPIIGVGIGVGAGLPEFDSSTDPTLKRHRPSRGRTNARVLATRFSIRERRAFVVAVAAMIVIVLAFYICVGALMGAHLRLRARALSAAVNSAPPTVLLPPPDRDFEIITDRHERAADGSGPKATRKRAAKRR